MAYQFCKLFWSFNTYTTRNGIWTPFLFGQRSFYFQQIREYAFNIICDLNGHPSLWMVGIRPFHSSNQWFSIHKMHWIPLRWRVDSLVFLTKLANSHWTTVAFQLSLHLLTWKQPNDKFGKRRDWFPPDLQQIPLVHWGLPCWIRGRQIFYLNPRDLTEITLSINKISCIRKIHWERDGKDLVWNIRSKWWKRWRSFSHKFPYELPEVKFRVRQVSKIIEEFWNQESYRPGCGKVISSSVLNFLKSTNSDKQYGFQQQGATGDFVFFCQSHLAHTSCTPRVPQGSVYTYMLYLLYMNDFSLEIKKLKCFKETDMSHVFQKENT